MIDEKSFFYVNSITILYSSRFLTIPSIIKYKMRCTDQCNFLIKHALVTQHWLLWRTLDYFTLFECIFFYLLTIIMIIDLLLLCIKLSFICKGQHLCNWYRYNQVVINALGPCRHKRISNHEVKLNNNTYSINFPCHTWKNHCEIYTIGSHVRIQYSQNVRTQMVSYNMHLQETIKPIHSKYSYTIRYALCHIYTRF